MVLFTPGSEVTLPNPGLLRAAAAQLRNSGNDLASRAGSLTSAASAIGPGTWQDSSSGRVKTVIDKASGELLIGRTALHDVADALETLARTVAAQQIQADDLTRQETSLAHTNPLLLPSYLTETSRIAGSRAALTKAVSQAMATAAHTVDRATGRATLHKQPSNWSKFVGGLKGAARWTGHTAKSFGHGVFDVLDGAWDGTVESVKGVVQLAKLANDFNPAMLPTILLTDRDGWLKRQHDRIMMAQQLGEAFKKDPRGTARMMGAGMLNLDDLKKNPAHWAGGFIPMIIEDVATDGAAAGAQGIAAANGLSRASRAVDEFKWLEKASKSDRIQFATEALDDRRANLTSVRITDPNTGTVHQLTFTDAHQVGFTGERLEHVIRGEPMSLQSYAPYGHWNGGHLYPGSKLDLPGEPRKPAFPEAWNTESIINNGHALLEDPSAQWTVQRGAFGSLLTNGGNPSVYKVVGQVEGEDVLLIFEPAGKGIITFAPVSPPLNP